MKKTLAIALSILFTIILVAQPSKPMRGPMAKDELPNIEKMVSNLTPIQKKRIETITANSKKEVFKLKTELESIRSQIGKLNNKEGDQSSLIFPLFDRESQIMAEISKEMYRCRLKIDEVLTPEQIKEFRNSLETQRQERLNNSQPRHRMNEKPKFSAKSKTNKN